MVVSESWIVLIAGLVGAGIGAGSSVFVTFRQIKASTVSVNRQDWINALRDEIAKFISILQVSSMRQLKLLPASPADANTTSENLLLIEAKIKLLINPLEDDHKQLIKALEDCTVLASQITPQTEDPPEIQAMTLRNEIEKFIQVSQRVLKNEWNRVKKGK